VAAEESYPDDLRYHREHDWVRLDGDEATFGITWYAQDALGEVVYFEPPAVGDRITADSPYGELESVKAVSDVIAPLSGEVTAVNDAVVETPDLGQHRPYGEGWLAQRAGWSDASTRRPPRTVGAYRAAARGA
jgi:glycine cleavage system H protein